MKVKDILEIQVEYFISELGLGLHDPLNVNFRILFELGTTS